MLGNILDAAVVVEDVNTVICLVVHILLDAGGRDEISRFGERDVQLFTDLQS